MAFFQCDAGKHSCLVQKLNDYTELAVSGVQ
jgi:hypothetical protein